MKIDQFNELDPLAQQELFKACCGAEHWAKQMIAKAPFASVEQLLYFADYIWENAHEQSWLEAFIHHSKIGSNYSHVNANQKEQEEYKEKFGYPFIYSELEITEKEILFLITERLSNSEEEELFVVMQEQQKITKIKLGELFREE